MVERNVTYQKYIITFEEKKNMLFIVTLCCWSKIKLKLSAISYKIFVWIQNLFSYKTFSTSIEQKPTLFFEKSNIFYLVIFRVELFSILIRIFIPIRFLVLISAPL